MNDTRIREMTSRPDEAALADRLIGRLSHLATEKEPSRELGRFVTGSLSLTVSDGDLDRGRLSAALAEAEHRLGRGSQRATARPADVEDADVRRLRDLALFGLKGIAAYSRHAAMFGREDEGVYAFILRALGTLSRQATVEELTDLVFECGRMAVVAMSVLDEANLSASSERSEDQMLPLTDKIMAAVKAGRIRRFVVIAGCEGRHLTRNYFTQVALGLPRDAVILTAGCSKLRYVRNIKGEIAGIPRVLDAGACNDSYSLARIAMALRDAFDLTDVTDLPIAFDIAWYEQNAVAVLLALLSLGFRNVRIGPSLPVFLSEGVAQALIERFGLCGIGSADGDVRSA